MRILIVSGSDNDIIDFDGDHEKYSSECWRLQKLLLSTSDPGEGTGEHTFFLMNAEADLGVPENRESFRAYWSGAPSSDVVTSTKNKYDLIIQIAPAGRWSRVDQILYSWYKQLDIPMVCVASGHGNVTGWWDENMDTIKEFGMDFVDGVSVCYLETHGILPQEWIDCARADARKRIFAMINSL